MRGPHSARSRGYAIILTQNNLNNGIFIKIGLCYSSYSEQAFTHTNGKDKHFNALQINYVCFREYPPKTIP